jgi:hypothetical protein
MCVPLLLAGSGGLIGGAAVVLHEPSRMVSSAGDLERSVVEPVRGVVRHGELPPLQPLSWPPE